MIINDKPHDAGQTIAQGDGISTGRFVSTGKTRRVSANSQVSDQDRRSVPGTTREGRMTDDSTFEPHLRVSELADQWGVGRETVRKLVKDEPGVAKIRMGKKQSNTTYSVPESVARRIHARLVNAA
jgi:hypothetical protein